ncbi:MAG: M3 family peptidase, partial [Microbacteriaceae bacterium]|nr:M3 family peptidase [Microbacteriaceae bacterium]
MRMLMVFYNKSSSDTSDRLDEIEAEIAPKLAAHMDEVRLNQALFSRIKHLHENRDSLELGTEDAWLLERYYLDFTHAGAHLTDAQREELMVLNEKLSGLETKFGTNLLNDTNDLGIFVEDIAELDGLDENQIAACAAAAKDRDQEGKYFVAMVNFTGNPALANLTHRGLREKIMKASLLKGGRDNENDNRPVLLEIVKLRAQRAELFGVKTHAEYVLQDRNAQNPENVHKMLKQIAPAAVRNARAEGAELQKSIEAAGENFELASWDWDLYTEKVRLAKYNLDTSKMKPYFELERVLHDGVFFAANKLFGITFKERKDIKTYHPEARAFEVFNED